MSQYKVPAASMQHPTVGTTYQGIVGVRVVFFMNGAKRTKSNEHTQNIVVGGHACSDVRSVFHSELEPNVRYNNPTPTRTDQ